MTFQFNTRRTIRLFTTRHSTWRATLICAFVFSAAIAMGYIGTAANPDVARRVSRKISTILGNPPVSAKDLRPELGEGFLTVQDPLPVQEPLPPLTTDKTGYLFGETVKISGFGFLPGETVTLQVKHADGSAESGAGHDAFTTAALPDGTISATWSLSQNDSSGNNFVASALGSTSGVSLSTAFSRIAMVRTNKFDYEQGETVSIQGNGFDPNETVTVRIVMLNGKSNSSAYNPFSTTSDGSGNINTNWLVDPTALDSILLLTASGSLSGLKAQTIFTDVVVTVVDDGGVDDEVGQKDLNQLSTDNGNLPTSMGVMWNWDDTAWTGGNSGDACGLFDTDGDGFANYALCVTVTGVPATFQSTRLYSCGDGKTDRCDQPNSLITTFSSSCTATVVSNSDPFKAVASHGQGNQCRDKPGCVSDDTVAACTIQLSDFQAPSASLLNVCSFPSQVPNSDPSECVITPNSGFLTIKKTTQTNDSTSTDFAFNTTPSSQGGVSSFSKSITGQQADVVVANMVSFAPTNSLSITEVVPSEWDLTNATCAVQTTVPQSTGTFNGSTAISGVSIQSGLETICTFTNTAFNQTRGKIIVDKVTNPGGDTTSFDFTTDYGSPFSLTDAATPNDSGFLEPGNYSVSETANSDYSTTATCTSTTDSPQDPSSIDLSAGEVVTCTFTNTKKPKLTVIKHVINDSGGTAVASDFTMNVTATNPSSASFAGAEAPGTTITLDPGAYSVSESGPSGYAESQSADCSGTVAAGDVKTCTVTNNDIAPKLIVIKHVVNDSGGTAVAGDFTMTVNDPGTDPPSFPGAEAPGTEVIVDPGAYSVSESGPSGYAESQSADCSGTIAIGETKTCTVTNNDIAPTLKIIKYVVPTTDSGKFNLTIDGSIAGTGTDVGNGGTTGFVPVNAGNHTVGETAGTGTTLSDYVTVIGGACGANGSVSLALAENKTCTITNTKKGMVTITKYTNGQLTSMAWNFSLTGPGGVNASDSTPPTLVDFGGVKLIPGETYRVCETGIPAGWTLEWQGDSPPRDGTPDMIIPFAPAVNTAAVDATLMWSNVFDPNYVAPPATYTNDTRCVNFKVAPGETMAFSINNSFPGGEPRTIGYWKNWNSCSGGNQMITAASNGGTAAGWYTLDDLLNNPGYTIGDLHLGAGDCLQAVRILDKSDIATGKKMASDAAYNLAAQLLAAQLNLSAGAETCPAVITAVTAAQTLLANIDFDGTGAFLKKGAQYNQANTLAATLDRYNNGLLCP